MPCSMAAISCMSSGLPFIPRHKVPHLPAEEMLEVNQGDDFGWPYCYYDQQKNKKVLNPEYGGDGDKVGRCAQAKDPIIAFPGHWAPNALCFY